MRDTLVCLCDCLRRMIVKQHALSVELDGDYSHVFLNDCVVFWRGFRAVVVRLHDCSETRLVLHDAELGDDVACVKLVPFNRYTLRVVFRGDVVSSIDMDTLTVCPGVLAIYSPCARVCSVRVRGTRQTAGVPRVVVMMSEAQIHMLLPTFASADCAKVVVYDSRLEREVFASAFTREFSFDALLVFRGCALDEDVIHAFRRHGRTVGFYGRPDDADVVQPGDVVMAEPVALATLMDFLSSCVPTVYEHVVEVVAADVQSTILCDSVVLGVDATVCWSRDGECTRVWSLCAAGLSTELVHGNVAGCNLQAVASSFVAHEVTLEPFVLSDALVAQACLDPASRHDVVASSCNLFHEETICRTLLVRTQLGVNTYWFYLRTRLDDSTLLSAECVDLASKLGLMSNGDVVYVDDASTVLFYTPMVDDEFTMAYAVYLLESSGDRIVVSNESNDKHMWFRCDQHHADFSVQMLPNHTPASVMISADYDCGFCMYIQCSANPRAFSAAFAKMRFPSNHGEVWCVCDTKFCDASNHPDDDGAPDECLCCFEMMLPDVVEPTDSPNLRTLSRVLEKTRVDVDVANV